MAARYWFADWGNRKGVTETGDYQLNKLNRVKLKLKIHHDTMIWPISDLNFINNKCYLSKYVRNSIVR